MFISGDKWLTQPSSDSGLPVHLHNEDDIYLQLKKAWALITENVEQLVKLLSICWILTPCSKLKIV